MDKTGKTVYFLGANTPQGFYSLYDEWINQKETRFYVLKGGPGCGKSTLMKKIGAKLEADGAQVEYIICSGDPDSLDGIYLPEKRVAIVDGTSPHAVGAHAQNGAFKSSSGCAAPVAADNGA